MNQKEIFKEQQSRKNIRVEVNENDELWVFNNFWSKESPIVKFKNWRGLPKYFIDDEIETWKSLFWESCQIEEIDLRQIYMDMKKDHILSDVYKERRGKKSFLDNIKI